MKKSSLLLVMMFAVTIAFGQKALRTTAFNDLRKGQLDKAMQNIEPTISDPSTMSDPKTWFYRGNIYLQIHMSDKPEYKSLDPEALSKAYDSYKKLLELDTKKEYYTEAIQNIFIISEQLYNQGVTHFSAVPPDYNKALLSFEKAVDVNASYGNIDTLAIFNAGLSAENAKNFPKAKQFYNRIIELNYPQPLVYNSLSSIYLEEKDTATAIATITAGRLKYPDNFNLLIAETNIYLASKNYDKAMANLREAIKTDPNNPTIHYAVGVNYSVMNDNEAAEASYLRAIELNPDYFEASYNLGALYVNQAAVLIEQANKLPLSAVAEYDKLKLDADEILKKSIPHLENATRLNAEDKSTLLSLKEIYTRLGMNEKRIEIDTKISNLK